MTEVMTPFGKLLAYENPDPKNPGLIIDLKPEGKAAEPLGVIGYEEEKKDLTASFWPKAWSAKSVDISFKEITDRMQKNAKEAAHES